MSPSSNSVYSSIHFLCVNHAISTTHFVASIGPHRITCFSTTIVNISFLIVGFGDSARACGMDTLSTVRNKLAILSTKVFSYLMKCL